MKCAVQKTSNINSNSKVAKCVPPKMLFLIKDVNINFQKLNEIYNDMPLYILVKDNKNQLGQTIATICKLSSGLQDLWNHCTVKLNAGFFSNYPQTILTL